jgi:hypothetical protein
LKTHRASIEANVGGVKPVKPRRFAMINLRYGICAAAIAMVAVSASSVQAQPYGYGMMGGYGPGYGMMGGYGPGTMMGPGYGYGMMGGYGPGWMMGLGMMGYGGGYGPGGMMRGYGYGPGMMGYGPGYYGSQGDMKLTTDQVKNYLEQMNRNPNLTVGDVKEKDADTIVADIVTKQGQALVQRLDFNRHNGFVRPEQ